MVTLRILCALLFLAASVTAADWPAWRGPEHNGISREVGLVDSWDPVTGMNVLWDSPIGGRAAPIVMNGRIYLQCRTSHDVSTGSKELIRCSGTGCLSRCRYRRPCLG